MVEQGGGLKLTGLRWYLFNMMKAGIPGKEVGLEAGALAEGPVYILGYRMKTVTWCDSSLYFHHDESFLLRCESESQFIVDRILQNCEANKPLLTSGET